MSGEVKMPMLAQDSVLIMPGRKTYRKLAVNRDSESMWRRKPVTVGILLGLAALVVSAAIALPVLYMISIPIDTKNNEQPTTTTDDAVYDGYDVNDLNNLLADACQNATSLKQVKSIVKQIEKHGIRFDPNWHSGRPGTTVGEWGLTNGSFLHHLLLPGGPDENTVMAIAKFLIEEKGAAVDETEECGPYTPLIYAAGNGYNNTVKYLLDKGAAIEHENRDGMTALHEAAKWSRLEVVRVLLEKGANFESKNNNGMTALMMAASTGRTDIAILLLAKGADINAKDNYGQTALRRARNAETVQLLLDSGASTKGCTHPLCQPAS